MSSPTVSVIIPVSNGVQHIEGAVDSVLNQTFQDFEILVVDDGSTDATKAAIEPWIKQRKIRYFYQQNKGPAAARNIGIRHAEGQYLKFLDCDDLLYSEQLQRQVDHLKDRPSSVISATGYDLEFDSKKRVVVDLWLDKDQLGQFIGGNPCPIHSILVARSLVDKAGSFDESLLTHEDSDLWLRILIEGGVFEKVDYIGCCYRIIGGTHSADASRMFRSYCNVSEKLNRALIRKAKPLSQETLRQLYYRNLQTIHQCFAQGIEPLSSLPLTLRMSRSLYAMKTGLFGKMAITIRGFKSVAKREYRRSCEIDKNFPKKLMGTSWRDEKFYTEKFRSVELVPRSKKIKNILYLNSGSVVYGAETRLLDILRNLDKSKFQPFVILPHPGPLDERLKELGVVAEHLEYGFPLEKFNKETIMRVLRLNRDFLRVARRNEIDLIHVNLHLNMGKFWLAFFFYGKPVIVHMRSHAWLQVFEKFVICRTFKAIFISKFVEREFFQKRRSDVLMWPRRGHAMVLYDGIDINHFNPWQNSNGIRGSLNVASSDFLVGMVGAVDKIKGQDLLIEAAGLVVAKHPNTKFVIVGDLYHQGKAAQEYRESLLKLVKDNQLTDHVVFTGARRDINFVMNEVDLLVQPSEREALGTAMVEAMSCGKPIIGTDVDGIPEVIGNNEAGILFNPRTPEALAKAINFFIENPEEARKRGAQGRERALQLFNIYENVQKIHELYSEALSYTW